MKTASALSSRRLDEWGLREARGGSVGRRAGRLRWCVLFLGALLMPEAAWGQSAAVKERMDHELWESVGECRGAESYLKALPKGLHAEEARDCPAVVDPAEIVLPDGLTLADWALMAEGRLEAGDHARLLEEADAHLREYGRVESVAAIREQAVSGLIGKARAHGLLGDHAEEEEAYLQWLRAVPQTHPERRDVLTALVLARAAHKAKAAYEEAKEADTVAAYRAVVEAFPDSPYTKRAQARIAKIEEERSREPGVYLTVDVLVGQQISSSHLQTVHTNLIPPDEIRGYSMVRGGCYHRPGLAGSRLDWDDIAPGCSP